MNAIITNKLIIIKDPTSVFEQEMSKRLSYKDRSKEFQLRRLASNPANKYTAFYKKLQREAHGSMLHRLPEGHLAMSAGFAKIIIESGIDYEDRRALTGTTVPLPWKSKPYPLRDYQKEAVDVMDSNYRGVINFATGLGKTLAAVHYIKKARTNTLVIAPGDSIAKQFYKELVDAFGESKVGFFGGGKKKPKEITVGIAASITRNVDLFKDMNLGLIIFDEAHHTPASTFFKICWGLGDCGKIFGLTATDYRNDGKDIMIQGGCGSVIISRDIKWGIDNGWLAKPEFIMRKINTNHRRNFKNDKVKSYKEHVLNCKEMKDAILEDAMVYLKAKKQVLILVNEVAHGEELSRQLGAAFATGKDKASQDYISDFNDKKIQCLIGTSGKISEGTDTRPVEVLIMAGFMASKGPVIQSIGRGLRKVPGKDVCIILDYMATGSSMLKRHAEQRIEYYKEIVKDVKIM